MNFTDGTIARPEVIAEPDNALREAYSSARQQRARLREIFDVRPDLEARFVDAKRILAIARNGERGLAESAGAEEAAAAPETTEESDA